jgi:anhydro-N-acetylmuramic acid kinase
MAEFYIGLISGTSMDGIDAVLVDFSDPAPTLLASASLQFDPGLRRELDRVRSDPDTYPTADLARLDAQLGDQFAEAASAAIKMSGMAPDRILAIGSHGQTIVHRANEDPPYTLQIGDPHRIAFQTGITTVADFRRADLAAGGQGAPLAPLLHHQLLRSDKENRLVVNLGGIANITVLPAAGGVTGFDTGPANCFLDDWFRRHHDGRYDESGRWAASGQVDTGLLERLLDDPFFALKPPKSTGIEYFSSRWLAERLPDWATARPADIQATLAEFSAASLARAILGSNIAAQRLIVCGGGVHNSFLMARIARQLPDLTIDSSALLGIDPDLVEATLFAWLARERLAGRRVNTPAITGAAVPVLCGVVYIP